MIRVRCPKGHLSDVADPVRSAIAGPAPIVRCPVCGAPARPILATDPDAPKNAPAPAVQK